MHDCIFLHVCAQMPNIQPASKGPTIEQHTAHQVQLYYSMTGATKLAGLGGREKTGSRQWSAHSVVIWIYPEGI